MKIVLARNIKYDYNTIIECGEDGKGGYDIGDDEVVRLSDIIEVDFPLIEADITAAKVALIDEDISKAEAGIHLLKQAKAELLSIPDMRGE